MSLVRFRPEAPFTDLGIEEIRFPWSAPDAGVAHPVERHLAKVEVASSSLVARSKKDKERTAFLISYGTVAKW